MISLTKMRSQLGLPATQDARVKHLRDVVVSLWESETHRLWAKRTGYTKTFRVRHTSTERILFLPLYPITGSPTVTGATFPSQVFETVSADNYYVDHDRGMIERISGEWCDLTKVVWTGGYEDDTAPAVILEALMIQARFMMERMSDDKIILMNQGFEGGSTNYIKADLHPTFKMTLKGFRKVAIGG